MAEVVLTNVSKTYPGGTQAVVQVSLTIADGEFVVLVGPSGCGKSTTLRMVAGLEDATSGTITIGGRVVNDVHPKDRDIAMVFQNYALYPHMTVYKNMAFALKLRRVHRDEIDRRVREAARILRIEELLDKRPRQLSGGQRQRVAVGRAIVREPKAFLFDEPLSNLDARLRVSTRAELKALHLRLKTTTIYVTHDQEEAMTLGDRVVVMSRGLVQQIGTPLDVYHHPANRFVAGFVGMPPMNFFDGSLERSAGDLVFAEGPGGPTATRVRIPPATAARLSGSEGRRIVLGIRPQALREAQVGAADAIRISTSVVELLGDQMDIYGATAHHPQIVARVHARAGIAAGSQVALEVDPAGVHAFEPGEFGRNLALAEAAANAA